MRNWRRRAIWVSSSLPPGLYRDSLLWCSNRASSLTNALSAINAFYGVQLGGVTEKLKGVTDGGRRKLNGVTDGAPEKGRRGYTFTHIERASVAIICL